MADDDQLPVDLEPSDQAQSNVGLAFLLLFLCIAHNVLFFVLWIVFADSLNPLALFFVMLAVPYFVVFYFANKYLNMEHRVMIIAGIGVFLILGAIFVPNYLKSRAQVAYTRCQWNCHVIGEAVEKYAEDHQGRYPEKLSQITPAYLKRIPRCSRKNGDTYSSTYTVAIDPDRFSFYCKGDHHKSQGTPANYPQYNSEKGLIIR